MSESQSVALIVPAAGDGKRLGLGLPKALVELGGEPMVTRVLRRFAALAGIVEVVVGAHPTAVDAFERALGRVRVGGVSLRVVAGRDSRQETVAAGLAALRSEATLVCVHDAARPLVSPATIDAVVSAARASGAATAAVRPVDSIRQDAGPEGTRALDRTAIWLVETPQVFDRALLVEAHRAASERGISATDDAALVEALCGARISIVPSMSPNLTIPTRADLLAAQQLLDD